MRRWSQQRALLVWVVWAGVSTGCVGRELRQQVLTSETAVYRFSKLMKASRTTRETERAFIDAMREAWTAVRRALRLENPLIDRGAKKP